jgi:hypothetical protein
METAFLAENSPFPPPQRAVAAAAGPEGSGAAAEVKAQLRAELEGIDRGIFGTTVSTQGKAGQDWAGRAAAGGHKLD